VYARKKTTRQRKSLPTLIKKKGATLVPSNFKNPPPKQQEKDQWGSGRLTQAVKPAAPNFLWRGWSASQARPISLPVITQATKQGVTMKEKEKEKLRRQ
jgi:hypothetical protein